MRRSSTDARSATAFTCRRYSSHLVAACWHQYKRCVSVNCSANKPSRHSLLPATQWRPPRCDLRETPRLQPRGRPPELQWQPPVQCSRLAGFADGLVSPPSMASQQSSPVCAPLAVDAPCPSPLPHQLQFPRIWACDRRSRQTHYTRPSDPVIQCAARTLPGVNHVAVEASRGGAPAA